MPTQEMIDALQAVRNASSAAVAKGIEDYKAANPPVDPQEAVSAAQADDVAAVNALAHELNPDLIEG